MLHAAGLERRPWPADPVTLARAPLTREPMENYLPGTRTMVKLVDDGAEDPALAVYVVSLGAGETVYREGEPGTDLYVVQRGRVELFSASGGATGWAGPGDVFGELGALESRPRDSGARTLEASSLLRIDGPTLEELVRRDPGLGLSLLWRVARRSATAAQPAVPAAKPAAPARPSAPRLRHETGEEFPLPVGDQILVGRRSGQVVPDLDLTSVDTQRSLSRRHARIVRSGSGFQVREEPGVPNGTFHNGERVQPGESRELKDGDEVGFGLVKLVFRA